MRMLGKLVCIKTVNEKEKKQLFNHFFLWKNYMKFQKQKQNWINGENDHAEGIHVLHYNGIEKKDKIKAFAIVNYGLINQIKRLDN